MLKHFGTVKAIDKVKTIDKVDYILLLEKVKHIHINGKVYNWIEQFFLERTQTVVVDGHQLNPFPVISGVPQGTVFSFGPWTLFDLH